MSQRQLRVKPTFILSSIGGIALAVIMVVAVSILSQKQSPDSNASTYKGIVITSKASVSNFSLGATHTQYSLDSFGDASSVASGKALINAAAPIQAQSIMGWGVLNPEPSPGRYDFSSLDARINTVMSGAQTKVITLAGAPDWMKGGVAGTTDWSKIEVAPTPSHYGDFANLAATIAARYPSVKYFQVWNELKGFWNAGANRWDYEGYTSLYNQVYAKIKAVRPDAQIGGPYVVMSSYSGQQSNPSSVKGSWGALDQRPLDVISYWLQHKIGADFVAVDSNSNGNTDRNPADPFSYSDKFTAVENWLKSRTTLPIWWSEWFPYAGTPANTSALLENAVMTSNAIQRISNGVRVSELWQAQGDSSGMAFPLGLITDTRKKGGGLATPFYPSAQLLRDHFATGTQLYNTNNSNANVAVLASDKKILLVNKTASNQTVATYNTDRNLPPYSVLLADVEVVVAPPPAPPPVGPAATNPTPQPTNTGTLPPIIEGRTSDSSGTSANPGTISSVFNDATKSIANIAESAGVDTRAVVTQIKQGRPEFLFGITAVIFLSLAGGFGGWYLMNGKLQNSKLKSKTIPKTATTTTKR